MAILVECRRDDDGLRLAGCFGTNTDVLDLLFHFCSSGQTLHSTGNQSTGKTAKQVEGRGRDERSLSAHAGSRASETDFERPGLQHATGHLGQLPGPRPLSEQPTMVARDLLGPFIRVNQTKAAALPRVLELSTLTLSLIHI